MTHESIDWNDPAAVEAMLASEGMGDIDESIATTPDTHIGVGRAAMTAASGNEAEIADFVEDNMAQVDLGDFLGE